MKAILLAAGKGTRLKPYTDRHPKCLIPIHGVPLLKIWIDLLSGHGVTEILINTHHHAEQVVQYLERIRPITPISFKTVFEPQLLGSAGTLWQNRCFVDDQEDFLIAYADNLTNLNWTRMLNFHHRMKPLGGVMTMGLIKAPDPSACGIVSLDSSNKIIKFVEKPEIPESNLANGGVYIAGKRVFDFLLEMDRDQKTVLDIGHHLLPLMVGKMYGFDITPDYLRDIGTPESYKEALNQWPPRLEI